MPPPGSTKPSRSAWADDPGRRGNRPSGNRASPELVPLLTARGLPVRVLSRDPERARRLLPGKVELVVGDVLQADSLGAAMSGVDAVVSAMTGFGPGRPAVRAVDFEGNLNLIRAAEVAGANRFVLLSMHGARPDHPMELLRMKHRAEAALRASGLDWTIVRPTVFMELWAGIVGDPIARKGRTTVFGRGDNPVNFVSARDVARFVELALLDPGLGHQTLDVGGPEDLTFNQLVKSIALAAGRTASVRHVPVPLMRLSALLLRPFKADVAGLIEAGISTDTADMSFDAVELRKRFPQIKHTSMTDVARHQFGAASPGLRTDQSPG